MAHKGYTISDLSKEVRSIQKQIRAQQRGKRVYFDTPFFQSTSRGHMRLVQAFRVADGKGYFEMAAGSPEREWSIAL